MEKSVGGVDFPEAIEGRVSGLFRHIHNWIWGERKKDTTATDRCLFVYNAYYYVFNEQTQVNQGVLAGFDAASQPLIYQDPTYGMDSVTKLANWFIAAAEGPTSPTYIAIVAKFKDRKIISGIEDIDIPLLKV